MELQVKNLTKSYRRHDSVINAIENLTLNIPLGSFTTVTGASGSGKTTLLLILGGLLRPTSGQMLYNRTEINLHDDAVLAKFRSNHIGFVMQNFALVPYLTALENIKIAINVKDKERSRNTTRALELLSWVGLEERINHYPKELSAGQQQRVAIARALANSPDIILADEPTGNLDPALSEEILEILKEINHNHKSTIIMVTHSPKAAEYGSIKIQLRDGKQINHNEKLKPELINIIN